MICTDSMHSRKKVRQKYPSINDTLIQQLYGFHTTDVQRRMWKVRKPIPDLFDLLMENYEKEYSELNAINLTHFYIDTTPVYFMFHCEMDGLNCRKHWKIRRISIVRFKCYSIYWRWVYSPITYNKISRSNFETKYEL